MSGVTHRSGGSKETQGWKMVVANKTIVHLLQTPSMQSECQIKLTHRYPPCDVLLSNKICQTIKYGLQICGVFK